MTEHRPIRTGGSLLERAAEVYDFGAAFNGTPSQSPVIEPQPLAPMAKPIAEPFPVSEEGPRIAIAAPAPGGAAIIDRARLAELGMLIPGAPIGALAEEFRLSIPPPKPIPGQPPRPVPNPPPQAEREIWIKKLAERPWPPRPPG